MVTLIFHRDGVLLHQIIYAFFPGLLVYFFKRISTARAISACFSGRKQHAGMSDDVPLRTVLHPHTILQHPIPSHTILYHPIPSIPHSLLNGWFHCGSAERGYPLLFTLTPLPTCHKSRVQSNGIRGNWADRKVQTDLGKWFGLTRVLVAVYVLCTSI